MFSMQKKEQKSGLICLTPPPVPTALFQSLWNCKQVRWISAGSYFKPEGFFFFLKEVSWQILQFFLVPICSHGESAVAGKWTRGSQEATPSKLGGLWDDNKRQDQREAAGLAGNGGREEGGEGRVSGVGGGGVLASPPPSKSHQWLSERGSV